MGWSTTTIIWPAHMQQNVTEPEWKNRYLHQTHYNAKIAQPTYNISMQQSTISLKFLSKGMLIYHLFIVEISTNQTHWPISLLGNRYFRAQLADLCGHAGQGCRITATWNILASLQLSASLRSQSAVLSKKEWANYDFPLYFMQF